jgi:hypothetical protein
MWIPLLESGGICAYEERNCQRFAVEREILLYHGAGENDIPDFCARGIFSRMWLRLAAIVLLIGATGRFAMAQSNTLTGVVVARGTGERLAYSIVGLPSLARERFATDSGVFYFSELPLGSFPLRIRRLGYAPVDTIVTVSVGQSDTVRIELARIAVQLGRITVSAYPPCENPGPPTVQQDSLLSVLFTQLRMNAEQYKFLAEQYPFSYAVAIGRSSRLRADGSLRNDGGGTQQIDGKAAWTYRPGRVISRRGRGFFFHIPTLVDFADRNFLAQHCFHFGGIQSVDETPLIRIDLVAAERIKDPDVNGTIYLNPETFQVKRTVLRLSRPHKNLDDLVDLEVTTTFEEIMPSIAIIGRVQSVQTMAPRAKTDFDLAYEEQRLVGFQFLRKKPGEDSRKAQ